MISIIIPQRNSLDSLPRLINSIPEREDIEVIVVDNTPVPISKNEINVNRDFILLHSSPERCAGGARNVGIEASHGEWLIFADADDFFEMGAFDTFLKYANSDSDLIYFLAKGVYDDTLEQTDRGYMITRFVSDFRKGKIDETEARLSVLVPWAKMVRRALVDKYFIRFDEVLAANDVMFSTECAYYSNKFQAVEQVVYVVTTRRGSLANRRDLEILRSRYHVALRRNQFVKSHGFSDRQGSVMYHLFHAAGFSISIFLSFLGLAIKYRQNIFIGWRNWITTFLYWKNKDRENKKYVTK